MLRLTKSQANTWQDMYELGKTDCRLGLTIFDRPFPYGHNDKWLEKLAWRTGWQAQKTSGPATITFVIIQEEPCRSYLLNPQQF